MLADWAVTCDKAACCAFVWGTRRVHILQGSPPTSLQRCPDFVWNTHDLTRSNVTDTPPRHASKSTSALCHTIPGESSCGSSLLLIGSLVVWIDAARDIRCGQRSHSIELCLIHALSLLSSLLIYEMSRDWWPLWSMVCGASLSNGYISASVVRVREDSDLTLSITLIKALAHDVVFFPIQTLVPHCVRRGMRRRRV